MDQNKSGKFIAKLRKEKNMTQEQLAEKMGVSINAVSKWERGLSFPDVSLYKKLCKELDINIEELINGEKDKSEEAKEKAIISTIKETDKIKKNSKKLLIVLSTIFVIIVCGLIYYNKNLKVNLVNDSDYLYDEVIGFIKEKEFKENPDSKEKDFNVFYSYHPFGIEKKNDYKYVYLWIKEMFPGIIEYQVLNFDNEKNINKLFNEVEQRKSIYYDYLNLDMSKITIDDLVYDDLIFSVEYKEGKCNIPVLLSIYKNNRYKLYTEYKGCKSQYCNAMLQYVKSVDGEYNYDVIEIIRHSEDGNIRQYTNDALPEFMIHSGKGHEFITDSDNKYLKELLKSIDVDLYQCAKPNFED